MLQSVAQSVTHRDDGETVGLLLRPAGGFRLAQPGEYVQRDAGGAGDSWLVPEGQPQARAWPREDGGWVDQFAALHKGAPNSVGKFASGYGWLRGGVPLVRAGALGSGPLLGERLLDWQVEARRVADLLAVVEAARALQRVESAVHRNRVLAHFQAGPPNAPRTLWVGPGQRLSGTTPTTGGMAWQVVSDADGQDGEQAVGFHYGEDRVELIPCPVPHGPAFGADLAHVARGELAELALYAVGAAMQRPLRVETHAVLTLAHGVRVAPRSLLGAVYLSLARRLFNRDRNWRTCPSCREGFRARRANQRYCKGDACRSRMYRQRRAEASRRARGGQHR